MLRLLNPGQAVRLRFAANRDTSALQRLGACQTQAAAVLKAWGVTASPNRSYGQLAHLEWLDEIQDIGERRQLDNLATSAGISRLQGRFPAFAAFLYRRARKLDGLGQPATVQELDELQGAIGGPIPPSLREFLLCARSLRLNDPVIELDMDYMHPMVFHHNPERRRKVRPEIVEMVLLCEFPVEADGDQLAFDPRNRTSGESPIFYYAHSHPRLTKVADTFDDLLSWWTKGRRTWLRTLRPWD